MATISCDHVYIFHIHLINNSIVKSYYILYESWLVGIYHMLVFRCVFGYIVNHSIILIFPLQ